MFSGVIIKHKASSKYASYRGPQDDINYVNLLDGNRWCAFYSRTMPSTLKFDMNSYNWRTPAEMEAVGFVPIVFPSTNEGKREIYKMIRKQFKVRWNSAHASSWDHASGTYKYVNPNAPTDDEVWDMVEKELEFIELDFEPIMMSAKQVDFFQECAPKKISKF